MIQYIFLTWQIALKWARKYFENVSNFKTAISETEKNFENLIAPNDSSGSKVPFRVKPFVFLISEQSLLQFRRYGRFKILKLGRGTSRPPHPAIFTSPGFSRTYTKPLIKYMGGGLAQGSRGATGAYTRAPRPPPITGKQKKSDCLTIFF